MRRIAITLAAAVTIALSLAGAPADACMGCPGVPAYYPPAYAYPWAPPPVAAYAYPPPYYYPPPAFYLGSGWDPDYRDIRYNRYFERYEPRPQIRGYTLR